MKYPALIRNISQKHNVGISANMKHCISACNGDLIAICEGDDYWTNPYKLQKQIQFIENNSDCSMVFSKIEINNIETNSKSFLKRQEGITKNKLDGEDFINDPNLNLIANFSSCLFRADILKSLPIIIYTYRVNEIAIAFYFEQFGKIGFIDEVLSVYRQHANGVWTGSSLKDQLNSGLKTREILKEICASKYKSKIQEIINEKYLLPLKNMS